MIDFNSYVHSNTQEAIQLNLSQAKAMVTCIMFSIEFIRNDEDVLYHALWAVDNQLGKLQQLFNDFYV